MRKYELQTAVSERNVLVELRCDLCGCRATNERYDAGMYVRNEVTLKVTVHHTKGKDYPEGGWGTEFIVDMCPECFRDKLIPWINSQGGDVQEKEWDW